MVGPIAGAPEGASPIPASPSSRQNVRLGACFPTRLEPRAHPLATPPRLLPQARTKQGGRGETATVHSWRSPLFSGFGSCDTYEPKQGASRGHQQYSILLPPEFVRVAPKSYAPAGPSVKRGPEPSSAPSAAPPTTR